MSTRVFQSGGHTGQQRRGIRFGASRLMTFKEAKVIPEYVLKKNLAALEIKKDRTALKMKREEMTLEMTLSSLNKSFGEYANLDTADDVRAELKKGIKKQMNAQREQAEMAKAVEKAAHGQEDAPVDQEQDESKPNMEGRVPTPVKMAMRRKKREMARKPKKPRPKYSDLKLDDKRERELKNGRSYDKLMESYGRGKNDEKLDEWLDVVYPRMSNMSATIIGMKKRLERYQSRESMETNPKEGGLERIMNNYKVYSMYPEALKVKRQRRRRGSSGSGGSESSRSPPSIHHSPKLPPIKTGNLETQLPSSMGTISEDLSEVSETDIRLELDTASEVSADSRGRSSTRSKEKTRSRSSSSESRGKLKGAKDTNAQQVVLPPPPKKGILHLPPIEVAKPRIVDDESTGAQNSDPAPRKKGKKVAILTPIQSREVTQVEENGLEKELDVMPPIASAQKLDPRRRRRGSMLPKTDEENKKKIAEIKAQIMSMRRNSKGEADFETEMTRRRSLMVLMGEDYDDEGMEWLVAEDDPRKTWKDVTNCRYLRGHDPPEMVVPDGPLQEFVFWKGDFARESTFEREHKVSTRPEGGEDGEGEGETSVVAEGAPAGYDSDIGAINEIADATTRTRKVSVVTKPDLMLN